MKSTLLITFIQAGTCSFLHQQQPNLQPWPKSLPSHQHGQPAPPPVQPGTRLPGPPPVAQPQPVQPQVQPPPMINQPPPQAQPVPVEVQPAAPQQPQELKAPPAAPPVAKAAPMPKAESGVKAETHSDATLFIFGMVATIVMVVITFSLAQAEDKAVKSATWTMMDMVIAIFLAVLFFQAVDEGVDRMDEWTGVDKGNKHFIYALHAIVMFLAVVLISFRIRKDKALLAVFCGCGAHFVSFASCGFAVSIQEKAHDGFGATGVYLAIPLLILFFVGFFEVIKLFFKKDNMDDVDDNWTDKINDVEGDFIAMAIAVVLTLMVDYVIPPLGGFNTLEDMEGVHKHTPLQQKAMLIYAACLLPVASFLVGHLSKLGEKNDNPTVGRFTDIACSVLSMMVAWSFLLASQWEFAAAHNNHRPICARLEFAAIATFVAFGVVVVLGKGIQDTTSTRAKAVAKLATVATSLVVGWSWEQTFDKAIETLVDDDPQDKFEYKMGLALGIGVIVIPLYAIYFKPAVEANTSD